jgi:predicted ATP-binding protein involved in virulence
MPHKSEKPRPNGSSRESEAKASYFLAIKLNNYRCFGEQAQKLDFSDGSGRPARWTILLGENGSGKTTVLQALVLFEVWMRGQFSRPENIQNFYTSYLSNIILPNAVGTVRIGKDQADIAVLIGTGAGLRGRNGNYTEKKYSIHIKKYWSGTNDEIRGLVEPVCFAYGAGRRVGRSTLNDEYDDSDYPSIGLFRDDANLINAEEWLLRLDYSASKHSDIQSTQQQRLEQVKRLLIELLPEVRDIRFTEPSLSQPVPVVDYQTPDGWVPLRGLGYGYRTLIAWMVDFASRMVDRYPDSPDPLAEPAVLLVDEIDLHLHPTWQRKIMGDLAHFFPNTQFIVTAHSPLIVQAAGEDANIALLRREGDHVVIENDLDFIKGWRVDQILTSDLFGLPTARPPEYDAILAEQKKILSKPKLTKADQKRLKEIEAKIDALPYGESSAQVRKMMDLIEETQRLLREPPGRKKA